MDKFKSLIEEAFEHAQTLDQGASGVRAAKRHLQQMAGELGFTDLALELRGRIASGEGSGKTNRAALVQTGRPGGRFNTKPPEQVFVNPTISSPNNVEPAATEEDEDNAVDNADDVQQLYAKIMKMAPSAILSVYGETSVSNMIEKLGGTVDAKMSPNQKAAFLKSLIKQQGEAPASE